MAFGGGSGGGPKGLVHCLVRAQKKGSNEMSGYWRFLREMVCWHGSEDSVKLRYGS